MLIGLTAVVSSVAACAVPTEPDRSGGATTRTTAAHDEPVAADEPAAGADPDVIEPINWRACDGGLECGSVTVPLDYSAPDGPVLDIDLVRVPAAGESVGSIFVNPGGPGASGIDFVRDGFRLDQETNDRYDLIGFDPRGIGRSNPLSCSVRRDESAMVDLSPDSAEESALLNQEAVEIVEDCTTSDADVLPHLTTLNVARDLDRLRRAVGDDRLHYYGLSYGTLLAVRYAQLYPEAVGHLVMDGVVDPDADLSALLRQQAIAFETGFERLDEQCGDNRCPADGITGTFDRVRDRLEANGPVGGVGATELVMASLLPAYSPAMFTVYAAALARSDEGDYTAIESLSDFFVSSVSFTAYAAFACADGRPPTGPDSWDRLAADLEEVAPRFGPVVANELRVCAFWPRPAEDPVVETPAERLLGIEVPVLVVGNTGDAATPLENAQRVASLFPNAHLVVLDSARHTAYNGSSCVRDLVAEYFADRTIADTVRCETG